MSKYSVTYGFLWETLYPPVLRKTVALAWGKVLMDPLQWLHDAIFITYKTGTPAANYSNVTAYVIGDRVVYTDRGVYEAIQATTGNLPTDVTFWRQVTANYIGTDERVKYTSQKILFEYALNRWFQSTGIFIDSLIVNDPSFIMGGSGPTSSAMVNDSTNAIAYLTENYSFNADDFAINVPLAVFNALASNDVDRENVIRDIADIYVIAGINYTVTPY